MSKEDFLNSLDKKSRDFVEFLLDEAWCKGYTEGKTEANAAEIYNRWD